MKKTRHSLVASIAAFMVITACSKQETPEPVAPAEPVASETANDLATRAGAPLFEGMGNHHHPITTIDPDAQRYFDQGLVIDFAFNHS